ncbi:MAG: TetR family transcriptional regulator [Moraxellaceae bacterium]|nr:TetR family transcriptional regulator [Moraxellaceae bacterium]
MRRTREEAAHTRERLLDAAEQLFAERGFPATRLDDISAAAGATRGAFYWHFKSKEEVFDAMLARASECIDAALASSRRRAADDPLGSLRERIDTVFLHIEQDERFRQVVIMLICGPHSHTMPSSLCDQANTLGASAIAEFAMLLRAAELRGQLPPGLDARLAAQACHSLLCGVIADWLRAPVVFDIQHDGGRMVDAFFESLRESRALRTAMA